ncbi:S8 family serine peptidase [Fulvivirgaceae bacterium BMA10]|uniref:S8 family serine peptidase n=1 Tax=Splendidivirga corallicola TaxID=3051826 RepID=A0ABT8KLB5_9BACT|nr:S8 family serine peptidase [Fulvivirgaceae bacterium BMA10]
MNKYIFNIIILFYSHALFAQSKYWIEFKDKKTNHSEQTYISTIALENRKQFGLQENQHTDIPINPLYIQQLKSFGINVLHQSKWLNAVSVYLDSLQLCKVRELKFVHSITPVNRNVQITSYSSKPELVEYIRALQQIGATTFEDEGLTGKDIKIGIIDVGFSGAKLSPNLKHIFKEKRMLGIRDFVDPENKHPFGGKRSLSDGHGTRVWRNIAGSNDQKQEQYGLAKDASFYLARTDHTRYEFRGEEDYWIEAIEWMDSLGVRLVNTSLGYSLGFDDPGENYSPEDMDGKTSKISIAARIAAEEKGMLIIVSAGNDGDNPNWWVISAPADAKGVVSVGATSSRNWSKIGYSGTGPEFLNYLKPNISCYSSTGTSFSAPIITGLAACIMQKDPLLSNFEIKEIIERSGHLYPYGNNYIGYGVPSAERVIALTENLDSNFNRTTEVHVQKDFFKIERIESSPEQVVIYHKKNDQHVSFQEIITFDDMEITINKPKSAVRSTVDLKDQVIEIFWKH